MGKTELLGYVLESAADLRVARAAGVESENGTALRRASPAVRAATGETVRKRTVETRVELTTQERQIARRPRDGYTNSQIGAELFLSARTVEWHLRQVFAKLGISSRRELHEALPDRGRLALPA